MNPFEVIVLGGGAAGLMCAIVAGQRGRKVVVLEGSNKIGKKILMSGGGRCNFTNLHCDPSHFLSTNPHFCVSALRRYTQHDFVRLVEEHGIAYHEKTAGQLFCDTSSRQILDMLVRECENAGVTILTHCDISGISSRQPYEVQCSHGTFTAGSLVVATGGLSIPKMGASDFGYRLARQFDLPVLETCAGLVPFTFTGALRELTERLSGISVPVRLSNDRTSFDESLLFTHRGLSGPASLQLSSYWSHGEQISLNLLPGQDAATLLLTAKAKQPQSRLRTALSQVLPKALATELQPLFLTTDGDLPLAEIPDRSLRSVAGKLQHWAVRPSGTEGYRTAEVTLGGIDTNVLSSRTMECTQQPGLFFIGEVVDVTGHLGGFNFQWAWSSGHAAGLVA